jgi:hypothetical protein
MGQFDLDARERHLVSNEWKGIESQRNKQGRPWLWVCGKRMSGQSSLPDLERSAGDAFTCTERGDGETTCGLSLEALSPLVLEIGISGACHEQVPGLVEVCQTTG